MAISTQWPRLLSPLTGVMIFAIFTTINAAAVQPVDQRSNIDLVHIIEKLLHGSEEFCSSFLHLPENTITAMITPTFTATFTTTTYTTVVPAPAGKRDMKERGIPAIPIFLKPFPTTLVSSACSLLIPLITIKTTTVTTPASIATMTATTTTTTSTIVATPTPTGICYGDMKAAPINLLNLAEPHPEGQWTSIYLNYGIIVADLASCCQMCYDQPGCYAFAYQNFDPDFLRSDGYGLELGANYCQLQARADVSSNGDPILATCPVPERVDLVIYNEDNLYTETNYTTDDFFYAGTGPCASGVDFYQNPG